MGKRNTNLIRRNGTYYIRCRVPKEHQSTIGKKEIILSLLTKDFAEARILCANVRYQILLGFENMVDKKDNKQDEPRIFAPTRDENGELKWWGGATEVGISTELAIRNSVRAQQPQSAQPAPDQSTLHPDAGKPWHTFAESYLAKRSDGDQREHRTTFRQMRKILGDKPIKDITKNDIISVVAYMKARKGNHNKPTVSYKTITKKLTNMRGFFHAMKANENLIAIDPVGDITSGVTSYEKAQEENNKRPFTKAELKKIFHSPLFKGCKSLGRVYVDGDVHCRNHKFWMPILAFYTGARFGELVQLEFQDIVKKEGGWFFDINLNSDHGFKKQLKNKSSIRFVPLHPDLEKIGFWDFYNERKAKSKDGRLFVKYRYGDRFNQDLLRINLKLMDPMITFHCLRHCFVDACREAELLDSVVSRLVGHTMDTQTSKYGSKDQFNRLTNGMNKIKFLIPMKHLFK